ncbi:MAG: ATP-binding protein, partial [Micrococcales bacterium]|nr:ATP-binding protein [Micrococcales bacterium]
MNTPPKLLAKQLIPRRAAQLVLEALTDTRVVLINGARQCGKSTLVASLASQHGAEWFSLDQAATLQAARHDPTNFVRQAPKMVIDEVQRAPELFLAMKELVDAEPSPGRFLLTGSARILGLRALPDALPGRMETIELWPLSQGEIDNQPDGLVDALFRFGPEIRYKSKQTRTNYIHRVARGGFPEVIGRESKRLRRFHTNYVADLINRDVIQLSAIEKGQQMRALVNLLAGRSGQILSAHNLANGLALAASTIKHYLSLLEEVYLIKRIPAWSRNLATRHTMLPKVAFADSGM